MTRLSRLHPYPAMVADELASQLVEEFVRPTDIVFDPFCGSGRVIVAAADKGASCLGLDVNPLACLITASKVAPAQIDVLKAFRSGVPRKYGRKQEVIEPRIGQSVRWFSARALCELTQLVNYVNESKLGYAEKLVVATALGAAARECSYSRLESWKLHRVGPALRRGERVSALDAFTRRLDYYLIEAAKLSPIRGSLNLLCGDVRLIDPKELPKADVVITSPPYGDSRTTVQYGAASALCLDFVSRIEGFEHFFARGSDIDTGCLGASSASRRSAGSFDIEQFWKGSLKRSEARRAASFLEDFKEALGVVASVIKPRGHLVLILGERSLGGYRLRLGRFAIEVVRNLGFTLRSRRVRHIREKRVPWYVNRFGGALSLDARSRGRVKTMKEELIFAFCRSSSANGL